MDPGRSSGSCIPVRNISPELVDLAAYINATYEGAAVMEPVGWRVLAPEGKSSD